MCELDDGVSRLTLRSCVPGFNFFFTLLKEGQNNSNLENYINNSNLRLIMPRQPFNILVFPYRVSNTTGGIEYALFKRSDLNFWQGIAGGGEENETPLQAAKRESLEESGIHPESAFIKLDTISSIPIHGFKDKHLWTKNPYVIPEYSFGVDAADCKIKISEEHTKYKWLPYSKALKHLKWDSNKTALWELNCRLMRIDPQDEFKIKKD